MTEANLKVAGGIDRHPFVTAVLIANTMNSPGRFIVTNPNNKRPYHRGYLRGGTTEVSRVKAWLRHHPRAMLSSLTGGPAGLFGVDIDYRNGGEASWKALQEKHKDEPLPRTASYSTPGGRRYVFLFPEHVRLRSVASGIAPGIDIKGGRPDRCAGQIILPPSVTADGGQYVWDQGIGGLFAAVEAPRWILFYAIFSVKERQQLAEHGIKGHRDFGPATPADWTPIARDKGWLRSVREPIGPIEHVASPEEVETLLAYVRGGVTRRCEELKNTPDGKRDEEINRSALLVCSLLNGAEAHGVDTSKLEEEVFEQFAEAANSIADEADDWLEKWGRCQADADPRNMQHVIERARTKRPISSTIEEDFGPTKGDDLEHPRDVSLDEIAKAQANALVKGLINPGEIGTIYGDPGDGKTFIAIDKAFHIALGRDWHGYKVKKAPVLYVALEGTQGFRKRMIAARERLGDPGVFFARKKLPVTLVRAKQGEQGAEAIIEACKHLAERAGQPVGLVVIDTQARAIAGDNENDTGDMSAFIENRVSLIARRTGAAVETIHHANRQGDIRGSSSQHGGIDFLFKVERGQTCRAVIAEKVKDGEIGPLFSFDLEIVPLGVDPDGDRITSCVVKRVADAEPSSAADRRRSPPMPRSERIFREAFEKLVTEKKVIGWDSDSQRVELSVVRQAFLDGYHTGEEDVEKAGSTKRSAWSCRMGELPTGFAVLIESGVEYLTHSDADDPHAPTFRAVKSD